MFSEEDRLGGDDYFADIISWKNTVVAIAPSNKTNTDYRPPRIGVATFGGTFAEEWRPKLDGMLFALPKIHEMIYGLWYYIFYSRCRWYY